MSLHNARHLIQVIEIEWLGGGLFAKCMASYLMSFEAITKISSAKTDYKDADYASIENLEEFLPPDILKFVSIFGQGSINNKLTLRPPLTWRVENHFVKPVCGLDDIQRINSEVISGVHIASTDIGDKLICNFKALPEVVLHSHLFGGVIAIGERFQDAITTVFRPIFGEILKATRLFFNSFSNERFLAYSRSDGNLSYLIDTLKSTERAEIFRNEADICVFFPEKEVLLSFLDCENYEKGLEVKADVGPGAVESSFVSHLREKLIALDFGRHPAFK